MAQRNLLSKLVSQENYGVGVDHGAPGPLPVATNGMTLPQTINNTPTDDTTTPVGVDPGPGWYWEGGKRKRKPQKEEDAVRVQTQPKANDSVVYSLEALTRFRDEATRSLVNGGLTAFGVEVLREGLKSLPFPKSIVMGRVPSTESFERPSTRHVSTETMIAVINNMISDLTR